MTDPCRWVVGHSRWATPYTGESQSPPARSLSRTGSEPHVPVVEPFLIFVHWGEIPVLDRKLRRNREWVNACFTSLRVVFSPQTDEIHEELLPSLGLAGTRAVLFCSWLIFLFRLRRPCRYEVSCDASSFCIWRREFCSSWVTGHSCKNGQSAVRKRAGKISTIITTP